MYRMNNVGGGEGGRGFGRERGTVGWGVRNEG
jgi:hypothetical protein